MQTYIAKDEYMAAAPEVSADGNATMSRLERSIRDFDDYYQQLTDVRFGARIARAHDLELLRAYGDEVMRAETMKRRLESALGAWETVKGWVGLGALPLIPLAIAAGFIAAIGGLVSTGRAFIRHTEIRLALNEDPDLTYEQAVAQVERTTQGAFGRAIDTAQWGLAAFVLWAVYRAFQE